ncbi:Peptidase M23 domain protein [Klebsormidium nitens]|uniref:Peptidase M23 domain protein n=1 Tax=Klebsormidium nitens TaxID=105231 RepID=A0A1Y1I9Y9_KLENI|nr:Peptidase M23 domain protein [Klebsormidium nitens]|eukprot:GAQ86772.1 Peptidase M23 domain protein [Klebsormidium nitens]
MAPWDVMHQAERNASSNPLHALVTCCEIQLHNLHNSMRTWQKSWQAGQHPFANLEYSDDAPGASWNATDRSVSGRSAEPGSRVKEGKSSDEISPCCMTRGGGSSGRSDHSLRWRREERSASLGAVEEKGRKGQARGVLKGIRGHNGGDQRKGNLDNQDGQQLQLGAARLSLLPFASINVPKILNPHLLGDPLASCRHAAPPAAQLIDRVKQVASSALLKRSAVLPEPDVKLSHWEPFQGDTVAVLVTVPRPRGLIDHFHLAMRRQFPALGPLVSVAVEKEDVPAFPRGDDGSWRALIPTTPLDKSGTRELQVLVRDGRHSLYDRVIYLKNRDYIIEKIRLPERKSGLIGGATSKELAAMGALRTVRTPRQLWSGPFLRPSVGHVTTDYGVQRYFNGQFAEGYYHRGVDYGAATGSPVVSPAGARVALVGREEDGFRLHGNCLGLDHGQGVVSTMLHLDRVHVKEGDVVKAGQVLGTVGETGIATGPHLHWGLYVNGECIDPEQWMQPQSWL